MSNFQLITEGFQILRASLAPYIARCLISEFGNNDWWRKGVWGRLNDYQRRNVLESGSFGDLVDSLDIANCLLIIDINWRSIFSHYLSREYRSYIKELQDIRNQWAHFGGKQLSSRDAWRALDTMSRLCTEIDEEAMAEIEDLMGQIETGVPRAPHVGENREDRADAGQAIDAEETQPVGGQDEVLRYMPKREWTRGELKSAVAEWCEARGRTTLEGFDDLGFFDAAEAALSVPLFDGGGDFTFRSAVDNIVFQVDEAKMVALTRPKDSDGEAFVEEPDANDLATDEGEVEGLLASAQKLYRGHEQFEYMPRQKAMWDRDAILQVVDNWSTANARMYHYQLPQWRLDTLADMVLSKFPGQNDMSMGFNGALPDTLFAPDTRKLFIITHL